MLPRGWEWKQIKDVIQTVSITNSKLKKGDYIEKGLLPVIDQGQDFIGGYSNNERLKVDCQLPVIIFGDHTKIFKFIDFDFVAGADGIKVLKPSNNFYPKLFYYFLNAIQLPNKGYSRHFKFLQKSWITVPPLKIQKFIVEKIEELFTKLDYGVSLLKNIKTQLYQYQQSILKSAFEGALTKNWRKNQKNSIHAASYYLEDLIKERKKQIKINRERFKIISTNEKSNFKDLPKEWELTKIGNILTFSYGKD